MPSYFRRLLIIVLSCLQLAAHATEVAPVGTIDELKASPLRPADTSSPRETLASFLRYSDFAVQTWKEEGNTNPQPALLASQTMDLSNIKIRTRRIKVLESIIYLKEILDRIPLPPSAQIPGNSEVNAQPELLRWRIPKTQITISKITEGPLSGQFLFSSDTIKNLETYYEQVQHLPYKQGAAENLLQQFWVSPGRYIPRAWIHALPEWTKHVKWSTAVWQWLALFMTATLSVLIGQQFVRIGAKWDSWAEGKNAWFKFGSPLALLSIILLILAVRDFVVYGVFLFGEVYEIVSFALWTIVFAVAAWLTIITVGRLGVALAHQGTTDTSNDNSERAQESLDYSLVRVLFRILGGVLVTLIAIYAAEFLGYSISPLIAGLSIGGLAVALAIRPLLENMVNGLTLYADGGVKVGEFCRYGDKVGVIEHIGLRSTKIRTLERSLVTIPNSEFAQMELDNLEKRDMRRMESVLRIRYDTSIEQLRFLLASLRDLLHRHPKVDDERQRVRFSGFGNYSHHIELQCYLRCKDYDTFLAIREDILLRIGELVEKAGSGFAYASQREFLGRAEQLNQSRKATAEQTIHNWRQTGKLPFPDFPASHRDDYDDSLDYPPEGSASDTADK
ncbi:mechanosensitive ion channel family protein [Neiella marina]|uniref:Mechanosensitive ion channel family protein n=1 Tax=Neiella holothuriorum TaxID=2870530 RepID=A0ABS7EI98_9GAMM|nr:mechanosensitive ion channel family protein [Neiella holothuriorum]MBW8192078.1 mechanosensitive ion channel family protein [Neiella holothuriorum]